MTPLAHGIGVVRDLPIPAIYFFVGAVVVLVASFVLLVVLWRRPLLEARSHGRALPAALGLGVLFIPVMVAGGTVGQRLAGRMSPTTVRVTVLVLATIAVARALLF